MLPGTKRRLNATHLTGAAVAMTLLAAMGTARAETVVQIPLTGVLDARSVTTLTQGNLVVFTLPTDGGNLQNAFATKAVALLKGKPVENALPDDGKFPANDKHPEVVLHFSNDADAASPQTHLVPVSGMFSFPVPVATYSKFFLFFNGAAGGTTIKVTFTYADAMDTQNATIPDYYSDPTDPTVFNLAPNLAKWDKTTTINEANHHNINGVALTTLPSKLLTSVKVERGAQGNLVFWGATGVATSDVAIGGGGGAGSGGAAGAGGSSGAGGALAGAGGAVGAGSSAGGSAGSSAGGPSSAGMPASAAGTAGAPSGTAGGFPIAQDSPASDAGCGCRVAGSPGGTPWLACGAAVSGWLARRRRRAPVRSAA